MTHQTHTRLFRTHKLVELEVGEYIIVNISEGNDDWVLTLVKTDTDKTNDEFYFVIFNEEYQTPLKQIISENYSEMSRLIVLDGELDEDLPLSRYKITMYCSCEECVRYKTPRTQ